MRLAPSASARSTISTILSMFARCTTAFTVRGSLRPRPRPRAACGQIAVIAGDVVGGCSVAVLDQNLHMIEPGFSQCAEGLVGNPDREGDEIDVKAGRMGAGGDVHEIASRAGSLLSATCAAVYGAGQGAALSWRGNPETASETAANVGVEIRAETPLALYPAAVTAAMTARMEGAEVFFSMARFSAKTGRRMGHIPIDGKDGSLAALEGITGRRVYQELPFLQRRHARLLLAAPAARRPRPPCYARRRRQKASGSDTPYGGPRDPLACGLLRFRNA
jgi:hypothetical protein